MRQDMFDEYLVAYVRRIEHPSLNDLSATVQSLGNELRRYVADCHAKGRKVAIWGAGGKGLSVMASAGIADVDLLVDIVPGRKFSLIDLASLQGFLGDVLGRETQVLSRRDLPPDFRRRVERDAVPVL